MLGQCFLSCLESVCIRNRPPSLCNCVCVCVKTETALVMPKRRDKEVLEYQGAATAELLIACSADGDRMAHIISLPLSQSVSLSLSRTHTHAHGFTL